MIDDDYLDDDYLDDAFDNSESHNTQSKAAPVAPLAQPAQAPVILSSANKDDGSDNDDLNFGGLDDDYGEDQKQPVATTQL